MHTAVGIVAQHGVHELGNHLLEFCHKLLRTVGVVLDLAQLVFPDAREFRTLEEFLLDQPDEGYACGSGFQTLALQTDVAALVER